ncbi:MAG: galactokinase [Oligoflexales bacterium]
MPLFLDHFGYEAEFFSKAHGRINLLGDQTNYNGGYNLCTVTPESIRVRLSSRNDQTVDIISETTTANAAFVSQPHKYRLGEETPRGEWVDYVLGVTKMLRRQEYPISGFDAAITSNVPAGKGLASGCALMVAMLKALRSAFDLSYTDFELVFLCQNIDTKFVRNNCGFIDPLACSLGEFGRGMFIDTKTMEFRLIDLPSANFDLVVVNSDRTYDDPINPSTERQRECASACRLLGVDQLRDLSADDLSKLEELPQTLRHRVRHVVTENERVLAAIDALERRNVKELGHLLDASHASLEKDFEVSRDEIDTMVSLAKRERGVYGARMAGSAGEGSVTILTKPNSSAQVIPQLSCAFAKKAGHPPTVLVPTYAQKRQRVRSV